MLSFKWKLFTYEEFMTQGDLLDCQRADGDLLIAVGTA